MDIDIVYIKFYRYFILYINFIDVMRHVALTH